MDKPIGKITHYYSKIGVAVVVLSDKLAVGNRVKISGHDQEFEQEITSMQVEHKNIPLAKKGEEIGLKIDQPVKEGDLVYKIK